MSSAIETNCPTDKEQEEINLIMNALDKAITKNKTLAKRMCNGDNYK